MMVVQEGQKTFWITVLAIVSATALAMTGKIASEWVVTIIIGALGLKGYDNALKAGPPNGKPTV
jgi:hypothetical protein